MLKSPSLRTLDCPMSLYVTYVHCGTWSSFYGMKPWVNTPAFWYGYRVIFVACSWIWRYTGVHRILRALGAYCDGPWKIKGKGRHCAAPIAVTIESVPPYGRRLGSFGYQNWRKGPGRDINHSLQRARNKQKSCIHDSWIAQMWCKSHMRLAYNAIGIRNCFEASIVRKGWAYQWANLKGL